MVWYHTNEIRVAGADSPYRYVPAWPTNPDTIVIASQLGLGRLTQLRSIIRKPMFRMIRLCPAFNPNEEHALMVGGVFCALRNDLNSYFGNLSQPYSSF